MPHLEQGEYLERIKEILDEASIALSANEYIILCDEVALEADGRGSLVEQEQADKAVDEDLAQEDE